MCWLPGGVSKLGADCGHVAVSVVISVNIYLDGRIAAVISYLWALLQLAMSTIIGSRRVQPRGTQNGVTALNAQRQGPRFRQDAVR